MYYIYGHFLDGKCSKRVNLKELNFYLSRGYTLGRMSKRGDDYV